MIKRCIAAGTFVLMGALAQASTFSVATPNSLTLTVLSQNVSNTVLGYSLGGTDGGTVDVLPGTVYLTDGVPLGLTPSSPNIFLILINAALTESGVLTMATPTVGGIG